jgi:hypothetical protein
VIHPTAAPPGSWIMAMRPTIGSADFFAAPRHQSFE